MATSLKNVSVEDMSCAFWLTALAQMRTFSSSDWRICCAKVLMIQRAASPRMIVMDIMIHLPLRGFLNLGAVCRAGVVILVVLFWLDGYGLWLWWV